jgi:sRNA-binding carbon storage regulator CsrA
MLILTRRVGETIYIGDSICLTVYDKLCYHVMLGVLAPPSVPLIVNGVNMRGAALGDGTCFYLLTLLSQDRFEVGDADVSVSFKPTYLGFAALRNRQVRIGVVAPRSITVDREEIRLKKQIAAGKCPPQITMGEWMRHVNLSASPRAAA